LAEDSEDLRTGKRVKAVHSHYEGYFESASDQLGCVPARQRGMSMYEVNSLSLMQSTYASDESSEQESARTRKPGIAGQASVSDTLSRHLCKRRQLALIKTIDCYDRVSDSMAANIRQRLSYKATGDSVVLSRKEGSDSDYMQAGQRWP